MDKLMSSIGSARRKYCVSSPLDATGLCWKCDRTCSCSKRGAARSHLPACSSPSQSTGRRWSGRGCVCCMRLWFSDSQCIWEKGGCRVMPTQSGIALHASTCIGTQRLFHVTGTSLYSVQYDARWSAVCPHSAHCTVGPTISSVIRDLSLDSRIQKARLRRRTQHSGVASPKVAW